MKRTFALVGLGGMLGATLTLAPVGFGSDHRDGHAAADAEPLEPPVATPAPSEPLDPTYNPSRSFAPLVQSIEPAVVAIEVEGTVPAPDLSSIPPEFQEFLGIDPRAFQPRQLHGEGSGFVVSADGLVLTNHHVVQGAESISARFSDGTVAAASVLGSDASLDVALLRLEGDRAWPFVELGTSEQVEVGDWVLAVGNPLGLGTTVTAGIISGKGRALGHDAYDDFLQTDAAINEGNSGGPLFDIDGRVIGINTAIIAGANTIGFAIPIDMVKDVMEDLETRGKVARGYLGVSSAPTDQKGVLVSEVYADTPAAAAGVSVGDVIVAVDEKPVTSPVDLVRAIGSRDPGDTVKVDLVRGGEPVEVELTLAERPDTAVASAPPRKAPPTSRDDEALGVGIDLRALTTKRAAELGVDGGVEIVSVLDGGPAEGFLRPGDVVLEVNHWPVGSPEDVRTLLDNSKGTALMLVLRGGARRMVAVPLP